jgi:2-oxoglutarate dehydrogenase E2 component (dihydrolipoamide succinyltransferase)
MPIDVVMPQMGESITEATVSRWLVKVGESVKRDQPLLEISTDKVDAEIPSPADGVLLKVLFQEGDVAPVDEVIARIRVVEEKASSAEAVSADEASAPVTPTPEEEAPGEDPATAQDPGTAQETPTVDVDRIRQHSSPVVRKMAAESGIDLSKLEGTGIHGRVTKRDLERYLGSEAEQADRSSDASAAATLPVATPFAEPAPVQDAAPRAPASAPIARQPEVVPTRRDEGGFAVAPYNAGENVEIVPMSKIRQITSAHMTYSKATSAHVSTVFHMDLSRVARARARAKVGFAAAHGTKLTYMPFIFKAVAGALKANPKLNASIDGTSIVFKKDINIGMAVALDRGLIVPVVRHADQLNLVGLARTANDLADRARNKKLLPEEVQGGTFTITNPGVFGSLFGVPIINQPQVGILGIGTIEKRPVVDTDEDGNDLISIKPMSYFAITFDHRLVDGADADAFMNDIKRTLVEETWSELDPFL